MFNSFRRLIAPSRNKPSVTARLVRPRLESLETRLAPAVATFVDDNWNLIADNGTVGMLDASDVVRNDNDTINPGTVTATLGTNGFGKVTTSNVGTVTGVPGSVSGAATINDAITNTDVGGTLTVLEGTYTENVVINKSLTLRSMGGSGLTTITGISDGSLGAVLVAANTNNVTIGQTGAGFTINGIDNLPAIDSAAVYLQGNQTGTTIRGNVINANGDDALFSESGATVSGLTIDANTFGGQTFTGTNPAGIGFGAQFTLPNVPRQLVVIGGGSGGGNTSNVTFTNNQITGTAGGISITDNTGNPAQPHEQGNTLVTIDSNVATISGNTFAGTTNRLASSLRARGPDTTISGNTFNSANLTPTASHVEIANTGQTLDQIAAANTFDRYAFVPGGSLTGQIGTDLQTAINIVQPGTTLQVLGTFPGDVNVNKAVTINGNFGAIGAVNVTDSGAVINGAVTAGAGLSIVAGSTLVFNLDVTPFVSSTVTGAVALNGATLQVNGANPPAPGSTFTLINNDGGDPVTGTFAGLAEGATVVVAGVPLSISYVGGDGNDVALVPPIPPIYAVGAGLGGQGHVKAFTAAGTETASFLAYPGYAGGVRVASADVNNDGVPDLITGTVRGTDHVKVFSGIGGSLLYSFLAFGGYAGGIDVAAGDVNNDSFADILVGAGPGAPGGHVKVFSGATGAEIRSFFSFVGFTGGVHVGSADLDNDGFDEVLVGTATGFSHVKGFSGQTGALLASFFAFSPAPPGGIDVAGGDVNGDGFAELFISTGPGTPGLVRVFNAAGAQQVQLSPYGGFTGGVSVGAADLNGDGKAEITTGAGFGAGPHVKRFDGLTAAELNSFFAFSPAFLGGVNV